MKIIVDAFGGDNAPLEILKGCEQAVRDFGIDVILTGNAAKITACAEENAISLANMKLMQADDVFDMCDEPRAILKEKSNTSMAVGFQALRDGIGDVFISAGSTGAMVMGATFIVKRIKGIKRPALATIMPSLEGPFMLTDIGANVECHKENLVQFAMMADVYMRNILGLENPRIALANIGTEPTKGTELLIETYRLLEEKKDMHFIGNIEAREIPYGKSDIVISDGFTGNMLLKMYEGVASAMMDSIKAIFKKNMMSKLSAAMVMGGLKDFKKKMDYKEFGGAPFMGVEKPVIKAHGSSDAKMFYSAIRQGIHFVEKDVIGQIKANLKSE